ncbi:membrane protein insertase YidC [bacterium]|nr:MAG: membrane protein insertase YidC [bacterium]
MDRNTAIGLSLIFIIFLGWMYTMQPSQEEIDRMKHEKDMRDSLAQLAEQKALSAPEITSQNDSFSNESEPTNLGSFAESVNQDTVLTHIETDLYAFTFSNVGAGPVEVFLKDYKRWDDEPVQLIRDTVRSAYSLGFISTENYEIETSKIVFTPRSSVQNIDVNGTDTYTLEYELPVKTGKLVYAYTFFGNEYRIKLDIRFEGIASYISSRKVDFAFIGGLNTTEKYRSIEAKESSADLYAGDEHEKLLMTEAGKKDLSASGKIDWVSTKSKFFTQVIKPADMTDAALLTAEVVGDISKETVHTYHTASLTLPIPDTNTLSFDMYLGPVRLTSLSEFSDSTDELVNVGYSWMRFFSVPLVKFLIIPFFEFLGAWIGNYGIVIILFGIVIKLVLYPFTKKSFESAAAMRQLNPEMQAIREKYNDNPQKQQEAILKLYKTAGVNPLGGCLPNLLQMPILVTLWMYFQNSILIRQKSFLWASDLSAPDVILNLPFSIPFIGDHIAGFVILMAVSMIVQMQTSGQTQSNPQMKFMPYMMPIVLFVFFNNVASGLSLYYFVYNVVSIAQQMLINKNIDHDKLMKSIEGTGKQKNGGKTKKAK